MQLTKDKEAAAFKTIGGYTNKLASPRLTKVVLSVGTGSGMKKSPDRNKFVLERLAKIAGQKPTVRAAKQSIASFKIRQGDPVGLAVTLRGARMYHFLDKLIHVAIPRTKDFRGIDTKVVDSMGNMTLGIKEHTIFPETADEDLRDVFSLAVTLVSTAKTKAEAIAFFTHLGIPFKK
ncbi:MAG TPA: 50S ribosomal protein L5 [Candidatus Paceibacterota bacterium]|nr:50S ribosomal protein L5 [Candidatus Paceibacterota bacterium]